jgi:translation initiation factor IF-2
MKHSAIVLTLTLGMSAGFLTAQARTDTPPAGERPPPPPADAARRGPQQRPGGLHLLPPGVPEILKLTAEQLKQVTDLEAEVKAKLEKILTPQQLEQLKQMRPPQRPGAPRPGAPGGAGRAPDGPGAPGGPGAPDRPGAPDGPEGQAPSQRPELEE